MCADTAQRDCFVRALLAASKAADGARTRVVLGVRADYYAHCTTWPELVTALRDAQVLVGPMDPEQLRDVIEGPPSRPARPWNPRWSPPLSRRPAPSQAPWR